MKTSPSVLPRLERSEHELVQAVISTLIDDGYRVRTEVPNMGQSADIVATKNRWLTAIEAKTKDWRRAMRQCRAHELVADFVCIAIGTVNVSEPLVEAVAAEGYGLIHCPPGSAECEWVVRPTLNKAVWSPQRTLLARSMRAIAYEC